jgi:hypothetical protein
MLFASAAAGGGIITAYVARPAGLAIRTGFIARWIALLGYAFALFLLLSGRRRPLSAETENPYEDSWELRRQILKVGARCLNHACRDLRKGCSAMSIPTAIRRGNVVSGAW